MQQTTNSLMKLVGTATVPAIPTFRAIEHFRTDRPSPVVIGCLGTNFCRVFLSGDGIVEDAVSGTTLRIHRLVKNSTDTEIIAELGQLATTTLGQMYEMMKAQSNGERGNLLVNGWMNIFYVPDDEGSICSVRCNWDFDSRRWYVLAFSVATKNMWTADDQVVSR